MAKPVSLPPFEGFPKEGVSWFRSLALAQNREWFQAHKAAYEALWLNPMKSLMAELAGPMARVYGRKIGAPKHFRINRDVRFSRDKSPYKTNIAAMLSFGNFTPMEGPVALYLHLGLEEVVGFGFYFLEGPHVQRLRKRVLDEKTGPAVQKLVNAATRKGLKLDGMEKLKRAPPGVDPNHPRIELLRFKALALTRADIPKSVRYSPALKGWLVEQAAAAAPVVKWGFAQKLLG